jgi:hypothetical protein
MAFTPEEKTSIREYLGWSARFGQTDTALERAMSAIEMQPSDLARARDHLAELARVDAAITACERRLKASQVGPITLNSGELSALRSRGEERVGRLATLFAVEVRNNPFRPGMPRWRGSWTGPIGGGNSQMQG